MLGRTNPGKIGFRCGGRGALKKKQRKIPLNGSNQETDSANKIVTDWIEGRIVKESEIMATRQINTNDIRKTEGVSLRDDATKVVV